METTAVSSTPALSYWKPSLQRCVDSSCGSYTSTVDNRGVFLWSVTNKRDLTRSEYSLLFTADMGDGSGSEGSVNAYSVDEVANPSFYDINFCDSFGPVEPEAAIVIEDPVHVPVQLTGFSYAP